ncbi:MAG TPA: hypothetical protein VKN35_09735 [Xanthomonadales bacterium]|nr:hypothetical protein [Xanthomonadales bacterium]
MQYIIPNVVAWILMIAGLSYLLQSARWISLTRYTLEQPERLYPTAIVMVAAGISIALSYDNYYGTWPLFVTLLGWLLAGEGALILLFPGLLQLFNRVSDSYLRWHLRIGGLIALVLGALLWRHVH